MAKTANKSFELYLCEKPSQGRDIARVLGVSQRNDGYLQGKGLLVSWCIGHLLEMLPPDAYEKRYKRWAIADLPILPQHWQLAAKKSTRKQLGVLKKLLKQCHSVVIATDADREGETIAREVLEHLNFQGSTRRLWLSALDTLSIQRALNNIRSSRETLPLYHSGLARGRADWLIGMNLTRAYTLLANDRQVRSVGRVQTPTLALIVNRDREIAAFKAETYYEVSAFFQTRHETSLLPAKWQYPQPDKADKAAEQKLCISKQQAQDVINRCQHQYGIVSTATTQRKKQAAPLLFNLSALQQEASRRWAYGAQEVLNIAQALYETHKLTSYPRSDCEFLPLSQRNDISGIFQALCKNDPAICELLSQADQTRRSRIWNDKKISAHHAIIPTQAYTGINRLNHKEKNIYDLIRRRYIAQFFPDYEYDQSIIVVTIGSDQFKASGRIPKIKGWKAVFSEASEYQKKSPENAADKELPAVTQGEQLFCDHLKLQDKQTRPPAFFTEGTLIRAMETIGSQVSDKVMKKILRETAGLGTQATRANIIQTLLQRNFIYKDKKWIKAGKLGFALCDAVPQSFKDPLLTAQWEQQLDDIAQNRGQTIDGFLQQQSHLLKVIIEQIKQPQKIAIPTSATAQHQYHSGDSCPECGHTLEIRQAARGKKVGQNYIGCSHFPDCRFYSWSVSESPA